MPRWHHDVAHVHQFHVKNQIGLFRNSGMSGIRTGPSLRAVSQLPRNEDAALAANLHAGKSLVKARNRAPIALREADRLGWALLGFAVVAQHRLPILVQHRLARMVVGRVELFPVVRASVDAKPAGVQNFVQLGRLSLCACADLDLLVAQRKEGLLDGLDHGHARGQLFSGCGGFYGRWLGGYCGRFSGARWLGWGLRACGYGAGR